MKIAVEGCCHGELDIIYDTLIHLQNLNNIKVDLLLICGDFQAIRNEKDLDSMAVPEKYRKMCSFWKYYAGVSKAPVLTIFIGGNHESSAFLAELPYGGWIAENIYYMGYANVIQFNGLRIAGLSGIYNSKDFYKGHYETPPFNKNSLHTIYHTRNLDTYRLSQVKEPIDIMLTHDWPSGVYHHGNVEQLLRFKPYFAEEINTNTLGSPENERLLKKLKPSYWFSAHLHVKFACEYKHEGSDKVTKFLALDKCLPKRKFLQVIDVEPSIKNSHQEFSLDVEWLAILKKTDNLLSVSSFLHAPLNENLPIEIKEEDLNEIRQDFQNKFTIPNNFKQTAPPHNSDQVLKQWRDVYLNDQTTLMCEMLNIRDPIRVLLEKSGCASMISESKTELYNNLLDDDDV